jgi:SagB-type dehydrogenase family enzyme
MIPLPNPETLISNVRLDARQSARDFSNQELSFNQVSVLLFAAQGRRRNQEKRLVPSAGARYPLELTLAVRCVESLRPGLYRYASDRHGLEILEVNGNPLPKIAAATFEAPWAANAAAALHISAVFERTTQPYADQPPLGRAERYVWMEAGHAAQNVALAAAALQLASVFIGGFDDDAMARAVQLPNVERSVGLLPLGFPD